MQSSGNVVLSDCVEGQKEQLFFVQHRSNTSIAITDTSGRCLDWDAGSHGACANIFVRPSNATAAPCVGWDTSGGQLAQTASAHGRQCIDVGSGGSSVGGKKSVTLTPVAPSAPSGAGQAYYNESAPSWGGAVIKEGGQYWMFVTAMSGKCSDPNDPNTGNCFVHTARIVS